MSALVTMAAELKAILGAQTLLTYGADWSEYNGVGDGLGEKLFHLDPLWATPAIGAVGIDAYFPLADWRADGGPDAGHADSPYDLDYLRSQIEGGEGYDYYYASPADRQAGRRTPITDGVAKEPWIWRAKDLRHFWSEAHYDRPGGVRAARPTGWVPKSKPILLTECGCGAIDKGANQPNIFPDAKSVEGGVPYFSNGVPDALMQRQVLRAVLGYWADPARNPMDAGGRRMVDRIVLWTWDARPYPAFPLLTEVWSDGVNHAGGHWLTGRLGGMASDELATALAADAGVTLSATGTVAPFLAGYVVEAPGTLRTALEPLLAASGASLRDTSAGLVIGTAAARRAVPAGSLVDSGEARLSRRRTDPADIAGALTLRYPDRERDYQVGAVTAQAAAAGPTAMAGTALVLDPMEAHRLAGLLLARNGAERETVRLTLPPSALALEVGDAITLDGVAHEIVEIVDGTSRRVTAKVMVDGAAVPVRVSRPASVLVPAIPASRPLLVIAPLPPATDAPGVARIAIGAWANPWPGSLSVTDAVTGDVVARLDRPAVTGMLTTPLVAGRIESWDMAHALTCRLSGGHLSARPDGEVLAGANRLAIETDDGEWEVLGFANATLTAPSTYRLTRLLRGQAGSDGLMGPAATGRRVLGLDAGVAIVPVPASWRDGGVSLTVFAGATDAGQTATLLLSARSVLPLAPAILSLRWLKGGDVEFRWLARSRADAESWVPDDAPADGVPMLFEVTARRAGQIVRQVRVATTTWRYAAADLRADFGAAPTGVALSVAQVSPLYGPGPATTALLR